MLPPKTQGREKRLLMLLNALKFGKAALVVMWCCSVDTDLTCHADMRVSVGQRLGANKILKFSCEVLLCSKEELRTLLWLYEVTMAVEQLNYLLVSYMSVGAVKSWCSLLGKQPGNCALLGKVLQLTKPKDKHKIHKCSNDWVIIYMLSICLTRLILLNPLYSSSSIILCLE